MQNERWKNTIKKDYRLDETMCTHDGNDCSDSCRRALQTCNGMKNTRSPKATHDYLKSTLKEMPRSYTPASTLGLETAALTSTVTL